LATTEMIDWLQLKWLIGYNWNDWLATTEMIDWLQLVLDEAIQQW